MADEQNRPLSTSEYFTMMLLLGIPVVNLVLLLVWAFGGGSNFNRQNLSRAMLIFTLIAVVVWVLSFIAGLTLFSNSPGLKDALLEITGTK